MRTLQEQFNLINEGKGHKDVFLKSARRLFPEYITNFATYNEAVKILKQKSVLVEAAGGVVTQRTFDPFQTFNQFVSEASTQENPIKAPKATGAYDTKAVNTKLSKEVEINQKETGYDNTNKDIIDNVYGQAFLEGYYAEMKDPKNEDKSVDQLKEIVRKNLAKSPTYYAENAAFGIKGIGYTKDAPGLGEPKAPKGKYKSSGYGDLKESYDYETQKDLKALAQDSNKLKDSNEVKKAAKFIGMNADDEDELGRLTKAYAKKHEITDSEAITHIIDQAYTIFKSRFSEMNEGLKKAFNKKLRESEINANPYSLYKSHPKFKEAEQAIAKALKTATKREDVENILKNYREAGADDTASREAIFAVFNKKLNESKLRSLVRNLIKEELNEGYGMSLEDAKAEAQRISQEEGVVQHVEETSEGSGEYRISDWYDSDLTVASYQNGMEL
jgi:hypothetical protein